MQIAIVPLTADSRTTATVQAFERELAKEHNVTFFKFGASNIRLGYFDFIVFGAAPASFLSKKLPSSVKSYLDSCGSLMGKRCYAFSMKWGWGANGSNLLLMKELEAQGLVVALSDVINSSAAVPILVKRLPLKIG